MSRDSHTHGQDSVIVVALIKPVGPFVGGKQYLIVFACIRNGVRMVYLCSKYGFPTTRSFDASAMGPIWSHALQTVHCYVEMCVTRDIQCSALKNQSLPRSQVGDFIIFCCGVTYLWNSWFSVNRMRGLLLDLASDCHSSSAGKVRSPPWMSSPHFQMWHWPSHLAGLVYLWLSYG